MSGEHTGQADTGQGRQIDVTDGQQRVRVERHGPIVVATLNRPERRNAVDHPTLKEMLHVQVALRREAPTDVRAVVLTGAPPAFCSGADLTGVEEGRFASDLNAVLRGFGELPVPVISAIDGPALGAGTQLVVAADLRVATADSTFGIPAAKLGLAVDRWTIRRVAAEFGTATARAMLIAAETFTGAELYRIGAVHRIGDLGEAIAWATSISRLAPMTMSAHKLGLEDGFAERGPDAFEIARSAVWASADAAEGRLAFLEKRPPHFRGR